MPRNGSGTYNPPAGQPVITGTTVDSTVFNSLVADLGTELTRSICTDGQTPMAGSLSMGNNKITNLATATLPGDAVRFDQVAGGMSGSFIQSGTGAVSTNTQSKIRSESCSVFDFMTGAEQTDALAYAYAGDYATHINNAYAAAAAAHRQLIIPSGGFRFTANLAWNQSVDVLGRDSEFVILQKDTTGGDFHGITISGSGQQSRYENFRLTRVGAVLNGYNGILVTASARMRMDRITIDRQAGHGLSLFDTGINGAGVFSSYTNLALNLNGGDGLHVDKHYASYFENLNLSSNSGWGFNLVQGNSHIGKAIICESNTTGGFQIATSVASAFEIYGESNIGPDMSLTSLSTRNQILMYHSGGVSDVSDEGTNNVVTDIGTFPMISSPTFSRIPRTTNTVGRDVLIKGGLAGPGASGNSGGATTLAGGDAAGGTIASGANVYVTGGEGIAGGDGGAVIINGGPPNGAGLKGGGNFDATGITINSNTQPLTLNNSSTGGTRIGGTASIGASVLLDMQSTAKTLLLPRMTTTQKNALSGIRGMIVYDSSLDKFQGYTGAGWVNLPG